MPKQIALLVAILFLAINPLSRTRASEENPTLHETLAREKIADLVAAAQERGDAQRGAALFFQHALSCARCHDHDVGTPAGPDLTKLERTTTDEYLIEAVLFPSKQIKKGYETTLLTMHDGRTITGIVAEEKSDALFLLDQAVGAKRLEIAKRDIDERIASPQSLMPEGLVNVLSDRQQFLDLAKYLLEVRTGGASRAKELRPAITALVIPEYEKELDHAGLLRGLDNKSLKRGEAIYQRICANCHGTKDQPGSLPTSPRFAKHTFKNGSDPYRLYQTLTYGYGFMAPQTWMVPRQKYDVIHYLRETYLKTDNATQYKPLDEKYLASLPQGKTFGPEPSKLEPWVAMDYGPSLINTYEVGGPKPNFAYKGIAVRLDSGSYGISRGKSWAMFDHDTLNFAAAWSGTEFIDWKGIHFNGQHQVHPKLVGDIHVANHSGPGWANPATGTFEDPRLVGRDGRKYGPLPKTWAQYRGLYHYGDQTIVSYTVGNTAVLESAGLETNPESPKVPIYTRTIEIAATDKELVTRLAPASVAIAVVGDSRVKLVQEAEQHLLRFPVSTTPLRVKVLLSAGPAVPLQQYAAQSPAPRALRSLTNGGPKHWPEVLKAPVVRGKDDGPLAVDTLMLPEKNPWNALLRLTGFDFLPDGKRLAVCSWDGDVWIVSGLDNLNAGLSWQRIASGLFQPLGLKLRDGKIYVSCRDQIVCLHDLNGDQETDYYECFNSDHQVTEHFHEFAMGLQTDAEGNFYYAKSGRHALPALVSQHGTLLKVSRDGATTEILATGFRAANGVCLNPDGTFFVTDQEGFWTPKNRINLVERGGFYGNMFGFTEQTDTADTAMKQPLAWITNAFDRSPAELVWVDSPQWGALQGSLLEISYGMGKIFVVPYEKVAGQAQGGMVELPLPTSPTGIMRGRFHPTDGQLYACGMFAWAGNQTQPGGMYRIRATGKPYNLPLGLKATTVGVELTFTDPLDPASVADTKNYELKAWDLLRSAKYGSKHLNEHALEVVQASLSADGKTVRLEIKDIQPTRGMEIQYRLRSKAGNPVNGKIHNTIHQLGPAAK